MLSDIVSASGFGLTADVQERPRIIEETFGSSKSTTVVITFQVPSPRRSRMLIGSFSRNPERFSPSLFPDGVSV